MKSMKSFLPFLAIGAMMEQSLPNGFGNANLSSGSASRDKATFTKRCGRSVNVN